MKFLFFIYFLSISVWAGQPLVVNLEGDVVKWSASSSAPITLHTELGSCAHLSNNEMLDLLEENLNVWANVPTADIDFTLQTGSLLGVDGCNYGDYLASVIGSVDSTASIQDNINPILFDDDGEIIDEALGIGNGRLTIFGFANPAGFSGTPVGDETLLTEIVDGQAVFNCYCLVDTDGVSSHDDCSGFETNEDDLNFTMVHEIGHFLGLDHSQNNIDLVSDGEDANDDNISTMFPVVIDSSVQKTLTVDDEVALSLLYPATNFFESGNTASTYCKVTGTILDIFDEELMCADVWAQSSDSADSVSFVTGAIAAGLDANNDNDIVDSGECSDGCGDFELYLRPGTTYSFELSSINSAFVSGSRVRPCVNNQLTACTTDLLTRCSDDDTGTNCTACVANEDLVTNILAQNITAKINAECVAGAIVNLGDIQSNSVATSSSLTETLALPPVDLDWLTPSHLVVSDSLLEEASFSTSCSESETSSGSGGCALTPVPASSLLMVVANLLLCAFVLFRKWCL